MIQMLLATVTGLTCIAIALRDILHELYHPTGSGLLARSLRRAIWRAFHWYARGRTTRLRMAGPAVLVATIFCWAVLVVIGFSLLYLPFLPEHFQYATPLVPAREDGLGTAVYLSLVALSTLGFGDITPTHVLLRIAVTMEAFLGFVLLTAGISWTLSMKPVLAQRRALAMRIATLREADRRSGTSLDQLHAADLRTLLMQLTDGLTTAVARLRQSPESYYFHPGDDDASLAAMLPYLRSDVIDAAGRSQDRSVRFHAVALENAVERLAAVVADQFLTLKTASVDQILEAYARDHLRLRSDAPPIPPRV